VTHLSCSTFACLVYEVAEPKYIIYAVNHHGIDLFAKRSFAYGLWTPVNPPAVDPEGDQKTAATSYEVRVRVNYLYSGVANPFPVYRGQKRTLASVKALQPPAYKRVIVADSKRGR